MAVEDLVTKRPRLAASLLQISAQRTSDFAHRIESLSIDKIGRWLARSLIRFSERLGTPEGDGSIQMMSFTHELLSQHIGTSREIVFQHMESVSEARLPTLFPPGDRPLPRCLGRVDGWNWTFGGCSFGVLKWKWQQRHQPR